MRRAEDIAEVHFVFVSDKGKGNAFERGTVLERAQPRFLDGVGNYHLGERGAALKRVASYSLDFAVYGKLGKRGAAAESVVGDFGHVFVDVDFHYARAAAENGVFKRAVNCVPIDGCKSRAVLERVFADKFKGFGKGYHGQARTALERAFAHARKV